MHGDLRLTEDLRQLAMDSVDLAPRLCGSCRNFHKLWPYHRLAGATGGDVTAPLVCSVLGRLLSPGSRHILIAGSADSGLLAVVARTASPGTAITVLDRCGTPLELCRRFAKRWSLTIDTVHLDVADLTAVSDYDVIFIHMLLQFIPLDRHLDILLRIRKALKPEGRLVLVFRTRPRLVDKFGDEHRYDFSRRLIQELEARNIPLPEPRESFQRDLEMYFEERRAREQTHAARADVEQLATDAGFDIEEIEPIDSTIAKPFVQLAARRGLQRFLMVAAAQRSA
jgi:SAM-dependent methyltransferase